MRYGWRGSGLRFSKGAGAAAAAAGTAAGTTGRVVVGCDGGVLPSELEVEDEDADDDEAEGAAAAAAILACEKRYHGATIQY